ncbi:MAG: hypothetical protein IPM48_01385 [Saprospiraceae bacterium]|nr:hypothetical protein [Saprospiraceae bacterium]
MSLKKSFLLVFLLFVTDAEIMAQNIWPVLSQVSYQKIKDENLGFEVDYPIFGSELKALNGKWVQLKGYIIPTDGYKSHKEFVFSAYPYKNCYFCGGAGPETVIEVESVKGIQFSSEKIEIRGKLKLNATDLNRLMFILTDAELIDP